MVAAQGPELADQDALGRNAVGRKRRLELTYFDCTAGGQPYKSGFRLERRPLFAIAEPVTLRGRLFLAGERAAVSATAALERRPALAERLRRVARWLRRRGAHARSRPDGEV